jgi:ethanolamine-phosphate phospho-lyase
MSVAGVISPPEGYLSRCYAAVRKAGGVCIADEVQTGLGRFGSSWWAFEQQNVCPDIVTIGKPFGNGMPLAAVVCTRAISDAFAKGPEYFNTFGGNPVCAAAGLAVLDAIERDGLRQNAQAVGEWLRAELLRLSSSDEADSVARAGGVTIGDVRGCGLFVGIELIRGGREARKPATAEASRVCSRLKDVHLILTSLDGPHDNVLVVKPPLCFSSADAARFVGALHTELRALVGVDPSSITHTPT